MKRQVSGALTLDLSGFGDALLEILDAVKPIKWTQDQVIGLLAGAGVPYELALAVHASMQEHGLGIIRVRQESTDPAVTTPVESPVEWFSREVGL